MQYRTVHFSSADQRSNEEVELPDDFVLNDEEVRVLGCLAEKEVTTPDYYPLTLNSLVSACNQKSSRNPVVSYSESSVKETLDQLREQRVVHVITSSDGRVPRYRHVFHDAFRLDRPQGAALCVLMLRGPQTVGEIRQRSNRLYDFASLEEVEETLQALISRETKPLVAKLERQAGTKEARYAHLLSGKVSGAVSGTGSESPVTERNASFERIQHLEEEIASLRDQVEELQAQFAAFQKQFE